MKVDHALATQRLAEVDGVVPRFPKVTVHLSEPDADGIADMTIEGSAHAEPEDVARALQLPVDQLAIRRHTPTTVGYVVSEPARPPSPGAVASRGRVRRVAPPAQAEREDVIKANVPAKRSRAKTAGRK